MPEKPSYEGTEETVFEYILREELEYKTGPGVPVIDNWDFKMHEHIRKTILYKYGQLADNKKDDDTPVENIIMPILNVAYRLEDIDVKDIEPYVNNAKKQWMSFLVKKFHDRWARKFEIDTLIDRLKTSWIDFGLGLIKNPGDSPEYVPLQRLAFCDQTDILSGPICEKHMYSPDQLIEMKGVWDDEAIDDVIAMSRSEKANTQVEANKAKTPGRYIEVYELHAMCREDWNPKAVNPDPNKFTRQFHAIAYYMDEDKKRNGIALFQGPEKELIYDAVKRDDLFGRACGYGGCEEVTEPQVWHTYSLIQMKKMLDVAALMIAKTTDAALAKRQKITDLEPGEILEVEENKDIEQLVFQPINWQVFDKWQADRKLSARTTGSANDPQLGIEPKSGTAMGLQQTVIVQGQGIHQYRKGIFSTFLVRLYTNWFLKDMIKEMNKGDEWIEELDLKEMQWVADQITENAGERKKKDMILRGESPNQIAIDDWKEKFKERFLGGGNKQPIKIIKEEFKDIPIDVSINIAGKQKDLANMSERIISFMRVIIATPQLLTNPGWADLLNQVIEYAGLNPVDFSNLKPEQLAPQASPETPRAPTRPEQAPVGA